MRITVTQKNINQAAHQNPEYCPIALAVKDAIGDKSTQVLVDGESVWIRNGRH